VKKYIGLDVHTASTTFVVLSATGKHLAKYVVETNGHALVEQLQGIVGERYVCLEEGTQSAWLYEILSPYAKEVVVATVSGTRGQKNDAGDAHRVAEQLRTGTIERKVFKEQGEYKTLRELSRSHRMIVQDVVRVKNRIKTLYRSRGVPSPGETVYSAGGREAFLLKLPEATRAVAAVLYTQHDALEEIRQKAEKDLVTEARRHAIYRTLLTCPGFGPIRVAHMLPIVVTPTRFRTKRQFWSYCGLGIVMQSSSDWVRKNDGGWAKADVQRTRGLNQVHNHTLKWIFKGAAMTIIMQGSGTPLNQDYQRLVAAGTKPPMAALTLARKIAAIALSMWKSRKEYDATKHRKQD
jgi:transposase